MGKGVLKSITLTLKVSERGQPPLTWQGFINISEVNQQATTGFHN